MPTATLTPDTLRKLLFTKTSHIRGSGFSVIGRSNVEWGLVVVTQTNGAPRYEVTRKYLMGRGVELDLLAKPIDFEGFCERFNEALGNVIGEEMDP